MPESGPVTTYSIVAIDKRVKEMGVAVQSHWFSVGSLVTWAEAGIGVVATQSSVETSYGPLGLALLRGGKSPQQALKSLLATDPRPEVRQIAILDAKGRVAVHTGVKCIPEAGHVKGRGFSCQANLMKTRRVWRAMASAFKKRDKKGGLAWRLMDALDAAQATGGDVRGRQSAAMLIVKTESGGASWNDRVLELRVEDHPEPLKELRRLIRIHEAYGHAERGEELAARGKVEEAMKEYGLATERAPEVSELRFWQAVALINHGRGAEARPLLRRVFSEDEDWRRLLQALSGVDRLRVKGEELAELLKP